MATAVGYFKADAFTLVLHAAQHLSMGCMMQVYIIKWTILATSDIGVVSGSPMLGVSQN